MISHKHTGIARLLFLCAAAVVSGCSDHVPLLDPKGPIAASEKTLILTAFGVMLIVVVPVILMTVIFAWRYRASNEDAIYMPNWAHSRRIELVVWSVPAMIVISLGALVWESTHELNPYTPLISAEKTVNIEAIAMDWKWLFIYPDQHIATVNQIVFPTHAPINLRITSDTVMASFFIPRLGSQIYAMPGMQTELHLLADQDGTYTGRNFQFSGRGYAAMHFDATATSTKAFQDWVKKVKQSNDELTRAALEELERPSVGHSVKFYGTVRPHLFDDIIRKYALLNESGSNQSSAME